MARILVVDDDDQLRAALKRFLEKEGFQVIDASDGAAGLEILNKDPVDLVITDIFMPEREGIGMIMELQQDIPDVKIIAISGGGNVESVDFLELAGNLGAHKVFQKPFTHEELLAAVQELLNLSPQPI